MYLYPPGLAAEACFCKHAHDCQVQAITGGPVCAHMDIDTPRFTALVYEKLLLGKASCINIYNYHIVAFTITIY